MAASPRVDARAELLELAARIDDLRRPQPGLRPHPTLTALAAGHALELASSERLDHVDRAGLDGPARLTRAGYRWAAAGENIARGQPDAASVFRSWFDSPGHRDVLLNPRYRDLGLGVVFTDDHPLLARGWSSYWVALFASPLGDP